MKKNPQMPSARRILGMVVGIVIIGLGIALFKQSHLGNDSISALNMRLAEMLGISLGVQNLCTNILFFALQFWFGRKYIGLGTFVNGIGVGFIVTAFYDPIAAHFGPAEALGLPVQLLWVALAVPVTCGAIWISGPKDRLSKEVIRQSVEYIKDTAQCISRELGYSHI